MSQLMKPLLPRESKTTEMKPMPPERMKPAEGEKRDYGDMELLNNWKQLKDKTSMNKLVNNLTGVMSKFYIDHLSHYDAVPKSAVMGEMRTLTRGALERYDPARKMKLSSYVYQSMMPMKRYVRDRSNIYRLPGDDSERKVAVFNNVNAELKEKLKREPTYAELSNHLGWSMKDIAKVERARLKDISGFDEFSEGTQEGLDRYNFIYKTLQMELPASHLRVFDLIYGPSNSSTIAQTSEKLKMEPSKVRIIKEKIDSYIKDLGQKLDVM